MASKMGMVVGVACVVVLGGVIAAIAIPRMGLGGSRASLDKADASSAGRGTDSGRLNGSSGEADRRPRIVEDAALAALRAELASAAPYTGRTDEERLADAWAWVKANRPPDRAYNEVEARILALMDVIFDGEARSIEWLMNASLIEVEMLRAMDTDGDGLVSDDEMTQFVNENLQAIGGFDHPYIKAKLDVNGDGEVSPDEMAALQRVMSQDGAFKGVLERAQLEKWDTNRDGFLTDDERTVGLAGAGDALRDLIAQQMKVLEDSGMIQGEPGSPERAQTERDMEEGIRRALGENSELAGFLTAQELMVAMRVENMDQQQFQKEMLSAMPKPPDYQSFDVDGDGIVGPSETGAFTAAMQAYQKEVQDYAARATAEFMRRQFEHAIVQSDRNADGRLTPDEWDARLEMLLAQRDQRLFVRSYDLDGDGRVGQNELMNFVDWHKAGSLRADANYDGVVDARDLEHAMRSYQAQGR